jgi:hypothetical protein
LSVASGDTDEFRCFVLDRGLTEATHRTTGTPAVTAAAFLADTSNFGFGLV